MNTEVKEPLYVLTQDQINKIAEIGARKGVEAYRAERIKADKKRARDENKVKKTKKMLASYRRIKKKLSEEVHFTKEEEVELRWKFLKDLMETPKNTDTKTEKAIENSEKIRQEDMYLAYRIEKATEMYREECEASGSEEAVRRYKELHMMYLDEKAYTVQEIAELENVSDKTVYKDLGIACGIVAVYLLGI